MSSSEDKSSQHVQWRICHCLNANCNHMLLVDPKKNCVYVECPRCNHKCLIQKLMVKSRPANGSEDIKTEENQTLSDHSDALIASSGNSKMSIEELENLLKQSAGPANLNGRREKYIFKLISPLLTRLGSTEEGSILFRGVEKQQLCSDMPPAERSPPTHSLSLSSPVSAPASTLHQFDVSVFRKYSYSTTTAEYLTKGDQLSFGYLRAVLNTISQIGGKTIVPLETSGDGLCLLHSISLSLIGQEILWFPLLMGLRDHFVRSISYYMERFGEFFTETDWLEVIEECGPSSLLSEGSQSMGLRPQHIQGLACVLNRAIIVLDGFEYAQSSVENCCMYIPFIGESDPEAAICISWANSAHSHFTSLVLLQGSFIIFYYLLYRNSNFF